MMKVNKFPWTKVQTINEASPILHIKNAIPKPHALEIGQAIIDISKDPTYKDVSNLNIDSNSGCWRGKPHLSDHMTHEHKFFLSELMMACSLEYKETITKLVDGELKHRVSEDWQQATNRMVFDAWSNVNDPGSGNIAHSHSHNFLSGVVYFHSTGTGGINFQPQNYLMGSSHYLWPWHGVSRYEPDDGDVIIFPSYMVHDVESNPHESRQRVNMAFNARIMDMEPL
jgi:hypothetical protein